MSREESSKCIIPVDGTRCPNLATSTGLCTKHNKEEANKEANWRKARGL